MMRETEKGKKKIYRISSEFSELIKFIESKLFL